MEAAKRDVAYFCPECGSASIEYSVLAGGAASCKVCGWTGVREKLIAYSFRHDFPNGEEALHALMNDVRKVYASASKLFAETLFKWGFLDYTETREGVQLDSKQLARYMAAAAQASLKAIIAERQKMEKERTYVPQ